MDGEHASNVSKHAKWWKVISGNSSDLFYRITKDKLN